MQNETHVANAELKHKRYKSTTIERKSILKVHYSKHHDLESSALSASDTYSKGNAREVKAVTKGKSFDYNMTKRGLNDKKQVRIAENREKSEDPYDSQSSGSK